MPDDVVLEVERAATHVVVRASGYLDVSTSPKLRERLVELLAADPPPRVVLIDLGDIEFIDSSALGVILYAWKRMQGEGETLAVVSPQARITKIFEITALNLSIQLFPSLADARAELGLD